jgi:hypothetical protein
LDTCGRVNLSGERYKKILNSEDLIAKVIIDNYRIWNSKTQKNKNIAEERSSTLFDTVAVYLAISQDLVEIEQLGLRIDDKGFTLIDETAKKVSVATQWKDLDGFRDFLVNKLTHNK